MRPEIILDWYEPDEEFVLIVPEEYEKHEHADVGEFFRKRDIDFSTCDAGGIQDARYKMKDNGYCTHINPEALCYFIRDTDASYGQLVRFIEDLHVWIENSIPCIDPTTRLSEDEFDEMLRRAREVLYA